MPPLAPRYIISDTLPASLCSHQTPPVLHILTIPQHPLDLSHRPQPDPPFAWNLSCLSARSQILIEAPISFGFWFARTALFVFPSCHPASTPKLNTYTLAFCCIVPRPAIIYPQTPAGPVQLQLFSPLSAITSLTSPLLELPALRCRCSQPGPLPFHSPWPQPQLVQRLLTMRKVRVIMSIPFISA